MKNFINSFINFIKSLNTMDIIFLIAIIGLFILLVSLIYVIKINNDDIEVEDYEDEDDITNNFNQISADEELDLVKLKKEIEENEKNPINLNDYEKEQEEKAVISYDELLALKDIDNTISYKNEKNLDGLTIKSVDTEFLTKPIELLKNTQNIKKERIVEEKNSPSVLISYDKEEAFLETLKKMNQLLN